MSGHEQPATPTSQHCNIYCDESRQVAERFMVLAGALATIPDDARIVTQAAKFRSVEGMTKEMKWGKVSKSKLPEYKRFIDLFFSAIQSQDLVFHALVLDTHKFDHKRFNQGDKELGFYKFFYQLLLHRFGGRYCRPGIDDRLHVFMDYRNSSYSLQLLREILNNGVRKNTKSAIIHFARFSR